MSKLSYKSFFVVGLVILSSIVLVGKLIQIQLVTNTYSVKAQSTTISKDITYPSRGLLYDRNGTLLVHNTPKYDLWVTYNLLNKDMDTSAFCRLINMSKSDFEHHVEKDWTDIRYSRNKAFVFVKNISGEVFQRFQESLYRFPGFSPRVRFIREYPYHNAGHVLGYISEVDESVLSDSMDLYEIGDYIGISGIEKTYEKQLRGQKGVEITLRDNLGRKIKTLKSDVNKNPISGDDIVLSIDLELQQYAESLLKNKTGSIVAIEPSTGEVLAMVSAPQYDPNILSANSNKLDEFIALQKDTLKPFYNRAISASYPPASIFKSVMALVALQEEVIHPYTSVSCPGFYQYETFRYGCHYHPKPRNTSIALQHSCNSYFFQTFRNLIEKFGFDHHDKGLDLFDDYLYDFGLGNTLGIDLTGEQTGYIPTSQYYDKLYPENIWKSTYIMSIGIGQGELLLTPLQMANLAAIIYNKGTYIIPHLIRQYKNGEAIPSKYRKTNTVNIDTSYFIPVKEGMRKAVRYGTAKLAHIKGIDVYGKTGTSQNPHGKDHSVFFAFANHNGKDIAIATLVENAGFGGTYAAPISSLIIEKYLTEKVKRTRLEKRMLELNLIH